MYMRLSGQTINEVDGAMCQIQSPAVEGRVVGPPDALGAPGSYQTYWKVLYGSAPKRIPSEGFFYIRVERNFE